MRIILPIVLLFIVLAVLSAHVNLPGTDEAWFASPALNLIAHGYFGTSVLDPTAAFRKNNLTGIDRHTYWIVPLYPLVQAAWDSVAGFGLMHVRYFSAFWGLVAMWAWYRILMIVTGDRRVAVLALGLMAVDFTFVLAASWGRMDMMAAALGCAGMAAYLSLREKYLVRAILVSQACVAAAGLSHPQALGYFAGLVALTLYCDWWRIRFPYVMAACVPYLVGAGGVSRAVRGQCSRPRGPALRSRRYTLRPVRATLLAYVRHGSGYQGIQPSEGSDSGGVCRRPSDRAVQSRDPPAPRLPHAAGDRRRHLIGNDGHRSRGAKLLPGPLRALADRFHRHRHDVVLGPAQCAAMGAGGGAGTGAGGAVRHYRAPCVAAGLRHHLSPGHGLSEAARQFRGHCHGQRGTGVRTGI